MTEIIYPAHYRIIERRSGRWFMKHPKLFLATQIDNMKNIEEVYGVSTQQILINLFRLNGGRSGFYLINLKHGKYYYCGQTWEDIKTQLLHLGIGRADPTIGECDE